MSKPLVYIKDPKFAWVPGTVLKTEGTKATVSVPQYKDEQSITSDNGRSAKKPKETVVNLKDYANGVLPLQNVDKNGMLVEYADMVKLPSLHEAGIMYNMKKRHIDGKPYTRTGNIVIAINPFQWFTHLYTPQQQKSYADKLVWQDCEGDPRDNVEPHVYEISSLSFKGLAFGGTDQSILVSGESGAGKTETVKIAMNHMAAVEKGPKAGSNEGLDPVVNRVVQSNPLLETFGNAKTRRNDNSSRFGKYLQLQFDTTGAKSMKVGQCTESKCRLAGSKCDVYLLEKNRVTQHDDEERTYHVFYQVLAAPESDKSKYWSKLKGKGNTDFKYIGTPPTQTIEKKHDKDHYTDTVATLGIVHVKDDKLTEMFRAIIAVMQCGNLTFGKKGGDKDKSEITSKNEVDDLADLLGVSNSVLSLALTERTMKTRTESYKVPLNESSAKEACDALAKEIYGNIFLWVVQQINNATRAEDNYKGGSMSEFGIIGLLDIFGFESFAVNRFEQLCINYANEKLQQKFTEDVFSSVQEEYEAEGIDLDQITYDDNTDVLDLIEGRIGLLALLNEECVRPKGNDSEFVQKAFQMNKKSPCMLVHKTDRTAFGIHHFAGKVMYSSDGFVASNQDTLPTDLSELCKQSSNSLVAEKVEVKTNSASSNKRQKSNLVGATIWGKYKTQLSSLMSSLRKTTSSYIRCIKPNMAKKPVLMDHIPTVEQLRCAGVVAAVTVSRSAFPNRLDNSIVRYRFGIMWDKKRSPTQKTNSMSPEEGLSCDCRAIMEDVLKCKETKNKDGSVKHAYAVGKTRTYFAAGALEYLEAERLENCTDGPATSIQAVARGYLARKKLGDMARGAAEKARKKREEEERIKRQKEKEEKDRKMKAAEAALRKKREEAAAKMKREKEERERQAAEEERKQKEAEKRALEAEERENKSKLFELQKKVKKMTKELEEKKQDYEDEVRMKNEEVEDHRKEVEELQRDYDEMKEQEEKTPDSALAAKKKKLDDSEKIVSYLKKENKRVREDTESMRVELDEMKEENSRLIGAAASAGASLDSLGKEEKMMSEHNKKMVENHKKWDSHNKQLEKDLINRTTFYEGEKQMKDLYAQALQKILGLIIEKGDDDELVEAIQKEQMKVEQFAAAREGGSVVGFNNSISDI